MGCNRCAARRRAVELARSRAQQARAEQARAAAMRQSPQQMQAQQAAVARTVEQYEQATAWHRWGWRFIHLFTMALPAEALSPPTLRHMQRVVRLFVNVLPCKDCQGHATKFLFDGPASRIQRVTTGHAMVMLMHELHNDVNRRTGKPQPDASVLASYQQYGLRNSLNEFVTAVRREPRVPGQALNELNRHLQALRM
jgi:hypothetical protein